MSRQKFEKTFNTFTKGLMTEASELNFPEDFSLYEKNFLLHRDGGRDRRKGMELMYPLGMILTSTLYPIEFGDNLSGNSLPPHVRESPTWVGEEYVAGATLSPEVSVISLVRYLEYLNWESEKISSGTLPPSVLLTSLVRYLEYLNWESEEIEASTLPPEVNLETTAAYLTYDRYEVEEVSPTTLPPSVSITTV